MATTPQLPNQIPPQSTPATMQGPGGQQVFETNWWLFLYNLANQVFANQGGASVLPPSVNIPMIDADVMDTDSVQWPRQVVNSMLLIPDQEIGASPLTVSNALALALDSLPQDPVARAQPVSTVTVTASPFTFTASFDGVLSVTAGAVTLITLIRQGTSVATGLVAGLIPVSRLDQVQITYTVAPTAVFLPS